jgi:hypothetical protein
MSDKNIPDDMLEVNFGSLDTLKIEPDDVLILKGTFTFDELQGFVAALKHRRMNNIIVCLSNDTTLETMKDDDIELILTNIRKKRANEAATATKIN